MSEHDDEDNLLVALVENVQREDLNPIEEAEAFFRTIPLGRVGECEEDIGQAVVALCQPELGYLTVATIPLDGGQANFD